MHPPPVPEAGDRSSPYAPLDTRPSPSVPDRRAAPVRTQSVEVLRTEPGFAKSLAGNRTESRLETQRPRTDCLQREKSRRHQTRGCTAPMPPRVALRLVQDRRGHPRQYREILSANLQLSTLGARTKSPATSQWFRSAVERIEQIASVLAMPKDKHHADYLHHCDALRHGLKQTDWVPPRERLRPTAYSRKATSVI